MIISCGFNFDTACVDIKYADGSMISIDCTRVENEVAWNMYEASEIILASLKCTSGLCESATPWGYPGVSEECDRL